MKYLFLSLSIVLFAECNMAKEAHIDEALSWVLADEKGIFFTDWELYCDQYDITGKADLRAFPWDDPRHRAFTNILGRTQLDYEENMLGLDPTDLQWELEFVEYSIVKLKADKEHKKLNQILDKKYSAETYNGVELYIHEKDIQELNAIIVKTIWYLKEENILVFTPFKAGIDDLIALYQGKNESITQNEALQKVIKQANDCHSLFVDIERGIFYNDSSLCDYVFNRDWELMEASFADKFAVTLEEYNSLSCPQLGLLAAKYEGGESKAKMILLYDDIEKANHDLPIRKKIMQEGHSVRDLRPFDKRLNVTSAMVKGNQLQIEWTFSDDGLFQMIVVHDLLFFACSKE